MKKLIFLLFPLFLFIFIPKNTFAQTINSGGWYNGYKDYVTTLLSGSGTPVIDEKMPTYVNGGSITGNNEYITLSPRTYYGEVGGAEYVTHNVITELTLYASAEFKKGNYYTVNFKFNHGSYVRTVGETLSNLYDVKLYDGNDYTIVPSNLVYNASLDSNNYGGNISISFLCSVNTEYLQLKIGNYLLYSNSIIASNVSDQYQNGWRIYLLDVQESQDLSTALLGQLASQNQTIIDQNNQTNQNLDKIEDSLTSEESPDISGLGDAPGWLPPGPLDSVLNLPLTLFQSINNSLGGTCSPVVLNLPYIDSQIILPCMSTIYEKLGIKEFLDWLGVIASGFILYNYLMHLYQWIEDKLTLKDTGIEWGGV